MPEDSLHEKRPVASAISSVIRQAVGSVLCMFLGAFLGFCIPGDANPAYVSLICLFAFFGWLFWVRRGKSVFATLGICLALIVLWWPFALALRDMAR
jgi:hypothetical protein